MNYTEKYQKKFLNGSSKVEELFKEADSEISVLWTVLNGKNYKQGQTLKILEQQRMENKQLKNELDLLRKQNEWVSVKDEVPENDEYYLVGTTDNEVLYMFYCDDGYWCKELGLVDWSDKVTHFKYLPESFKQKGDV